MAIFIDPILERIESMEDLGYSGKEICDFFGMSPNEVKKMITRRNSDNRTYLKAIARTLKNEGKSLEEISNELGKRESSILILLGEDEPIIGEESERPVKRRIGFM